MVDLIIEMNRLIQHIIVLQSETLKIQLIKANDTRQAKQNKAHELLIQSHALSQQALKFNVQKRLEDDLLIHAGGAATTNDTSIESGTVEHRNAKFALKQAHQALRKSIASAKESAQRRYRSPCRQKDRIQSNNGAKGQNGRGGASFDIIPA